MSWFFFPVPEDRLAVAPTKFTKLPLKGRGEIWRCGTRNRQGTGSDARSPEWGVCA